MSTSTERDPLAASEQDIIGLYTKVASTAVVAKVLHGSGNPQLYATRAVIAQTLRWAAGQFHPATEPAMRLNRAARQVDDTVPCNCGTVYQLAETAEQFATVAHDWNRIPRNLRGLPEDGRSW